MMNKMNLNRLIGFSLGCFCPLAVMVTVFTETYIQEVRRSQAEMERINKEMEEKVDNDVNEFFRIITENM